MRFIGTVLIASCLMFLMSCKRQSNWEDVEYAIGQNTDSALVILDAMELSNDDSSDMAHYMMLKSYVGIVKTGMPDEDSESVVYDYYSSLENEETEEVQEAYLLHAIRLFNEGKEIDALSILYNIEESERLSEPLFRCLHKKYLGEVYMTAAFYEEAVECFDLEESIARETGLTLLLRDALRKKQDLVFPESAANIIARMKEEHSVTKVAKREKRNTKLIWLSSSFAILLLLIIGSVIGYQKRRKEKVLKADLLKQQKLNDRILIEHERILTVNQKKTKEMAREMERQKKENQETQEKLHELVSSIVSRHYLPSQIDHTAGISQNYQAIVDLFCERNTNNKRNMNQLLKDCPSLSLREQVLCIIVYCENFSKEEIEKLLEFQSSQAFSMARSRLRLKLQDSSAIIAKKVIDRL